MNEGLPKKINLYGLTMIAIGSCIGSGIFRTPSEVALLLPSQGYTLVAWFLGGVIALTGALTFAELGSRFNSSGGIYIFLREAYGNLPAFLFGWAYLTVVTPGALAALSLVFADYAGKLFFLTDIQKTLLALATIISLSVINGLGVHISAVGMIPSVRLSYKAYLNCPFRRTGLQNSPALDAVPRHRPISLVTHMVLILSTDECHP